MTAFWERDGLTIHQGDCLEVMPTLAASSVSAIVTDPPYGLGFMGKGWDHGVPGVEFWREALRVTKPGGTLLAFGGTRTYHRLAVAVEDAGWEIRDCLSWLYGTGFPKSLDLSKALDKVDPRRELFAPFAAHYEERRLAAGLTHAAVCALGGFHGATNHGGASTNWGKGYGVPTQAQWSVLAPALELSLEFLPLIEREEAHRLTIASRAGRELDYRPGSGELAAETTIDTTAPSSERARAWDGYGTALKPAWEPIILAMKPTAGTFAENALEHGVAGLNLEECRIPGEREACGRGAGGQNGRYGPLAAQGRIEDDGRGRHPANLLLDETAAEALDAQAGERRSGELTPEAQARGGFAGARSCYGTAERGGEKAFAASTGGASRFFYTSKAGRRDRSGEGFAANDHPTVKPADLMRWLVRLVTMPQGTLILDPFLGSGSTLVAARDEHVQAVGIELDPGYCQIAADRLSQGAFTF